MLMIPFSSGVAIVSEFGTNSNWTKLLVKSSYNIFDARKKRPVNSSNAKNKPLYPQSC